MKFTVITLFPDFVKSLENYSIIGRAINKHLIELETINLRDFGIGNYKQIDDKPFGGNPGMLMRVDVVVPAIREATKTNHKIKQKTVLLCPTGKKFDQKMANDLAKLDRVVLVCGHYEGFDKRIEEYVDEKISIGDYVLSGGEIPAMAIIDSASRQVDGVLGNPESLNAESFSNSQDSASLEAPQYTRPRDFEGKTIPEVLLSGDPKKINEWYENYKY